MRREWEAMEKMSGDGSNEQGRGSGGVTGIPCEDGIVIAWDLGTEDSAVVHAGQQDKGLDCVEYCDFVASQTGSPEKPHGSRALSLAKTKIEECVMLDGGAETVEGRGIQ